FLREFERAVKVDGLKGAWITSSLKGSYPDDDDALPFFKLACELDVPVVIHPPSVGFGEERLRDYRLASSVGRPMDNALALARLIVRGIFEKLPTRSEEHTSELQSRGHLVCRLLLEKKKKTIKLKCTK